MNGSFPTRAAEAPLHLLQSRSAVHGSFVPYALVFHIGFLPVFHEKIFERRQHFTWERVALLSLHRLRAIHSGLYPLQQGILDMTELGEAAGRLQLTQ